MKKCVKILFIILILCLSFYVFMPNTTAVKYSGVVFYPEKLTDIDFIKENVENITNIEFNAFDDELDFETELEEFILVDGVEYTYRDTVDIDDETVTHRYYIFLENDSDTLFIETSEDYFYYYSFENVFSGFTNLQAINFSSFKEVYLDPALNYNIDDKYLDSASYENMFKDCTNLNLIKGGSSLTRPVINFDNMFSGCTNLDPTKLNDFLEGVILPAGTNTPEVSVSNMFLNASYSDGSEILIEDTKLFNIIDLDLDIREFTIPFDGESHGLEESLSSYAREFVASSLNGINIGTYETILDLNIQDLGPKYRFDDFSRQIRLTLEITKANIKAFLPTKTGTLQELKSYADNLDPLDIILNEEAKAFYIGDFESFDFIENLEKFEIVNPVLYYRTKNIPVDPDNYELEVIDSNLTIKIPKPTNSICINPKYNGQSQMLANIPLDSRYHVLDNENYQSDIGKYRINLYLNKDNYIWEDGNTYYYIDCDIDYKARVSKPLIKEIEYSNNVYDYVDDSDYYIAVIDKIEDGNIYIKFTLNDGYAWNFENSNGLTGNLLLSNKVKQKNVTIYTKDQVIEKYSTLISDINNIESISGLQDGDYIYEYVFTDYEFDEVNLEGYDTTPTGYIRVNNNLVKIINNIKIYNHENEDITSLYNVIFNTFNIKVQEEDLENVYKNINMDNETLNISNKIITLYDANVLENLEEIINQKFGSELNYNLLGNDKKIKSNNVLATGDYLLVEDNEYRIVIRGDVNCDGKIGSKDLTLVIKSLLAEDGDPEKIKDELIIKAGDYNGDNKIKSFDMTKIIEYMLKD